jgi:hypothetical protein
LPVGRISDRQGCGPAVGMDNDMIGGAVLSGEGGFNIGMG